MMIFIFGSIYYALFISAVLADSHSSFPGLSGLSNGVQYTSNWAGSVWSQSANTFTTISGTLNVPVPSGATNAIASAWVGIDGYSCGSTILQTGVDFYPDGRGGGHYSGWYAWYPDYKDYFDITISTGDQIALNINVHSSTSATVSIYNSNTAGFQSQDVSTSTHALCGQDAEWIVENPVDQNGNLLPFANFGTLAFFDAYAGNNGDTFSPFGAAVFEIQQGGQTLTSVSPDGSSSTVTITHN